MILLFLLYFYQINAVLVDITFFYQKKSYHPKFWMEFTVSFSQIHYYDDDYYYLCMCVYFPP